MRFSEIHRTLGDISHRMLTVTLRLLETDGMIRREVYAEVPPRVEYRLTERGGSLLPHIFGLVEWAEARTRRLFWTAAGGLERHPPGVRAVGVVAA